MLEVLGLEASYGVLPALAGVSLAVGPGEIVAIVGANGAGKSTLLNCVAGLHRPRAGRVRFEGEDLQALPSHAVVQRGVALVPEGRRLFDRMTVEENLELGAYPPRARPGRRTALQRVWEVFPRLRERRRQFAGSLSGGEQQMLAIGRALMSAPRLLMMDEPALGLAPRVVEDIFRLLAEIHRTGLALLVVEQNVQAALGLASRAYILEGGRVVGTGAAHTLLHDPQVRRAYLGPLALAP